MDETTEVVSSETIENKEWEVIETKTKDNSDNLKVALQQERQARKELSEKLAIFEKEKQDMEEKEKMKKGKYEEVISEYKTKLDPLEQKAKAYDELIAKQTQEMQEQFKKIEKEIPQTLKDKYTGIIDNLSIEKKVSFYKNLLEDTKKEAFTQTPWVNSAWSDGSADEAKAKALGFNAYMNYLLTKK